MRNILRFQLLKDKLLPFSVIRNIKYFKVDRKNSFSAITLEN